jgi:GMP synthase-like glutamine amidotransferase
MQVSQGYFSFMAPVNQPLRLRVFQHVPHEGLGSLESYFVARGAEIAYTRLFTGELPPSRDAFDFLIVLGGPMNVDDEALYPWLAPEKAAIRAALDAGKPVLGLCLGAQLMAVALGGKVTRNLHREIGWWPVERLAEAKGNWAAQCFPASFTAFHWHGDTFSIPAGATSLFCSEGCAHQGFAWGDHAVALQFHPEITADAINAWIAAAEAEGGAELRSSAYVQDGATMQREAADGRVVADSNRWMAALLDALLRNASNGERPKGNPVTRLFTTAKHWQLVIAFVAPIFLLRGFGLLVSGAIFYFWFYAIFMRISQKQHVYVSHRFAVRIALVFCVGGAFWRQFMGVPGPVNFVGMLAVAYLLVMASRCLSRIRNVEAGKINFWAALFSLWFFPFGIWYIQPKINRMEAA